MNVSSDTFQAFKEIWDARVHTTATELLKASGAKAVLVAIMDGPWMSGQDPACAGIAGTGDVDPFRVARDLRDLADAIEKNAADLASGQPTEYEYDRRKPVRQ